jgi:putative addiction module component (TIGR02574 family)
MKGIEELRSLPVAERIQIVEDLWDSIAEDSGGLQLNEAQKRELDRRLDDFEANPSAGAPWDQVRSAMQRKP